MRYLFWVVPCSALAALVFACSGSSSGSTAEDCDFDAGNDPQCPASYSTSYGGQSCPTDGLTCQYPGFGDAVDSNGCREPATLFCTDTATLLDASTSDDGGADASATTWVFGQ
jgi:hypothetical protein